MMRCTQTSLHRTGSLRGYVLHDATLSYAKSRGGFRSLLRSGVSVTPHGGHARPRVGDLNATEGTKHAFPLLTHTDFGYQDHAANTKWIELANYMPKRAKGTPPWWRGADTYSPLYAEQGRFEYQRYMMVSRFPSHYKKHFQSFLGSIRRAGVAAGSEEILRVGSASAAREERRRAGYNPPTLPQEALHFLLRMIVDNFNPQHAHYLAAMRSLMGCGEFSMARDVWRIMERQQTWPDDKLLACYLELCGLAGEKTWAAECWNRYCSEKTFLSPGEADPKPVSRVPFTLNRDELLYLPKWKKHFDHDPNLDVADLNRFNTTREIYRQMCVAMISCDGEMSLFETFFSALETAMLSTPTPVPEPPNPQMMAYQHRWGADPNLDVRRRKQWAPTDVTSNTKQHCEIAEMNARFLSNAQFLVRTVTDCIAAFGNKHSTSKEAVDFGEKMLARLQNTLGPKKFSSVSKHSLYATLLCVARTTSSASVTMSGDSLLEMLNRLYRSNNDGGEKEAVHAACYLEVLRGYADECSSSDSDKAVFDARKIISSVTQLVTQLADSPNFEWTADHHLAVVQILSRCGTMTANKYFVANVLRKFRWSGEFCAPLYLEYRRHAEVDEWAELTKRMLVWTERYGAAVPESCKRLIERDYDTIKVQVRSFREVAVFSFRDASERKEAQDPATQLSNPVMDYVSHALPFPDRDTGYPNEYGDIGQWRDPASGIKGPPLYSPAMPEDAQRGFTGEWRENTATANAVKMPAPWDRKYAEYNRGRHPSYDQIYAGQYPELTPGRHDFRRPTRWDFQNIESQSKRKWSGPY